MRSASVHIYHTVLNTGKGSHSIPDALLSPLSLSKLGLEVGASLMDQNHIQIPSFHPLLKINLDRNSCYRPTGTT